MKQILLLTGFLLLSPLPAVAQVTVNPAALQQLAGIEPPPVVIETAAPVPVVRHWKPKPHVVPVAMSQPRPHQYLEQQSKLPQSGTPYLGPNNPATPTAPVQTAAHVPPPAAPEPPAPLAPPEPAAPVALVFAPGSADLPANATETLKPFCAAKGHVAVDARAPTDPSDPSGAMRLSLSRAMAVQAALTACGVPPQNILPRAQGAVPGQNEDEAVIGGAK